MKPLSGKWVDKQLGDLTVKSRYTARGFEQSLEGWEDHYSSTPAHGMLRIFLVLAIRLGLSVCFGDCAQAFLQAPLYEDVWVTPPVESCCPDGYTWHLRKALLGLKGSPVAWGDHVTSVLRDTHSVQQSQADPCVYSAPSRRIWTLRHMDDCVAFGPTGHGAVSLASLMNSMQQTVLLSDLTYLDDVGCNVQFLGHVYTRIAGGFEECCRNLSSSRLPSMLAFLAPLVEVRHRAFARSQNRKMKLFATTLNTGITAHRLDVFCSCPRCVLTCNMQCHS